MSSELKLCLVAVAFKLSISRIGDIASWQSDAIEVLVEKGLINHFNDEQGIKQIELTAKGHIVLDHLIEVLDGHLSD